MKITVEQLNRMEACEDGIRDFIQIFGSEWEGNFTLWDQLCLLQTPLRQYLGWAWLINLLPMWSMRGLVRPNAHLEYADLRKVDLFGADLRSADLSYTHLAAVNLRGADLEGADLTNADLTNADLRNSILKSANLWNANLWNADLQGAEYNQQTRWPDGFDPAKAGAIKID